MKTLSLQEAGALIPHGATLMIGGFMGVRSVLAQTEANLSVPDEVPQMALQM